MAPQTSVMVPLYIYPYPHAWDPLYQAASSNPDTTFTVVVNPQSGPGSTPLADGNYTREIPKLTAFNNIRTLGYVATDYGQKTLNETLSEIGAYASWACQDRRLQLDGIFFDETPTLYSADSFKFMEAITTTVQQTDTLSEGFVVHNPGTIPDTRFMDLADITVVYEQTYDAWTNMTAPHQLAELQYDKKNMAALMHSVPEAIEGGLDRLVGQLAAITGNIFLTTLDTDYYCSFSPYFAGFVNAIKATRQWGADGHDYHPGQEKNLEGE